MLSVFVSRDLLDHRCVHSFCIIYVCYYAATTRLNSCSKDHMAHKVKNIYCIALYRKSLPTPAVGHIPQGPFVKNVLTYFIISYPSGSQGVFYRTLILSTLISVLRKRSMLTIVFFILYFQI